MPAGLEIVHLELVSAELVVPAVQRVVLPFAERHLAAGNREQRVLRGLARLLADLPERQLAHLVEGQAADDDGRGLQMDARVLDPHHDRPEGVVPVDGQRQRQGLDHLIDQCAHLVAVGLDLGDRRPVIVLVVQVVPRHLVDADGKQRLEARIDALLDDLGDDQLVDVKDRGVAQVKDQRVAQRLGAQEKGRVTGQRSVKLLVEAVGFVEIIANLGAFLFRVP